MSVEIINEIMGQDFLASQEIKEGREADLKEVINLSDSLVEMQRTSGWQYLEKQILDRTASLTKRLLMEQDEKKMYRTQGEILGIQSILSIVSSLNEDAAEARNILEEENNGKEED